LGWTHVHPDMHVIWQLSEVHAPSVRVPVTASGSHVVIPVPVLMVSLLLKVFTPETKRPENSQVEPTVSHMNVPPLGNEKSMDCAVVVSVVVVSVVEVPVVAVSVTTVGAREGAVVVSVTADVASRGQSVPSGWIHVHPGKHKIRQLSETHVPSVRVAIAASVAVQTVGSVPKLVELPAELVDEAKLPEYSQTEPLVSHMNVPPLGNEKSLDCAETNEDPINAKPAIAIKETEGRSFMIAIVVISYECRFE
jgi:hypothetical protein